MIWFSEYLLHLRRRSLVISNSASRIHDSVLPWFCPVKFLNIPCTCLSFLIFEKIFSHACNLDTNHHISQDLTSKPKPQLMLPCDLNPCWIDGSCRHIYWTTLIWGIANIRLPLQSSDYRSLRFTLWNGEFLFAPHVHEVDMADRLFVRYTAHDVSDHAVSSRRCNTSHYRFLAM